MFNMSHLLKFRYILSTFIISFSLIANLSHADTTLKDEKHNAKVATAESLSDFSKREPFFIQKQESAHLFSMRCSALYFVLQTQLNAIPSDKDLKKLVKSLDEKISVYEEARIYLIDKKLDKQILSETSQKEYANYYGQIIIKNWKKNGDIFQGVFDEDFNMCEDNFIYFKKLAKEISKEAKKM